MRLPDLFSCVVLYPHGGTGRVGIELGDQARCMLLVVWCPEESLRAVLDLHERDGQCVNTLGGSDTTHPATGSS